MSETREAIDAALKRALALARRGEGHTRPNPAVGAVVLRDGRVLGEGYHRRCGTAHAEAAALRDAARRGFSSDLAGATIVVTLEPCSRPGRVGACTDAIAAAGLGAVVYACDDPNPVNRGRAAAVLRRRGIACSKYAGDRALSAACRELVAPFATAQRAGRPFVTVKLALSLDGRICDDAGSARWISSATARARTNGWRTRVDALMVGAETVRKDDPSLLSHGKRNDDLLRVVVTRTGRLPAAARVFADEAKGRTIVLCVRPDGRRPAALRALERLGLGGVWTCRSLEEGLRRLHAETGALHVLCEGGFALARALADEGLADAWHAVLSPVVIGSRPLADARRFPSPVRVETAGPDVLALYRL
jgi:diaminohydroxyphosphoribosylaminopyrimidine deaminase/5-amino-6-(5-phosphoribosylamino)uracil reductase